MVVDGSAQKIKGKDEDTKAKEDEMLDHFKVMSVGGTVGRAGARAGAGGTGEDEDDGDGSDDDSNSFMEEDDDNFAEADDI